MSYPPPAYGGYGPAYSYPGYDPRTSPYGPPPGSGGDSYDSRGREEPRSERRRSRDRDRDRDRYDRDRSRDRGRDRGHDSRSGGDNYYDSRHSGAPSSAGYPPPGQDPYYDWYRQHYPGYPPPSYPPPGSYPYGSGPPAEGSYPPPGGYPPSGYPPPGEYPPSTGYPPAGYPGYPPPAGYPPPEGYPGAAPPRSDDPHGRPPDPYGYYGAPTPYGPYAGAPSAYSAAGYPGYGPPPPGYGPPAPGYGPPPMQPPAGAPPGRRDAAALSNNKGRDGQKRARGEKGAGKGDRDRGSGGGGGQLALTGTFRGEQLPPGAGEALRKAAAEARNKIQQLLQTHSAWSAVWVEGIDPPRRMASSANVTLLLLAATGLAKGETGAEDFGYVLAASRIGQKKKDREKECLRELLASMDQLPLEDSRAWCQLPEQAKAKREADPADLARLATAVARRCPRTTVELPEPTACVIVGSAPWGAQDKAPASEPELALLERFDTGFAELLREARRVSGLVRKQWFLAVVWAKPEPKEDNRPFVLGVGLATDRGLAKARAVHSAEVRVEILTEAMFAKPQPKPAQLALPASAEGVADPAAVAGTPAAAPAAAGAAAGVASAGSPPAMPLPPGQLPK